MRPVCPASCSEALPYLSSKQDSPDSNNLWISHVREETRSPGKTQTQGLGVRLTQSSTNGHQREQQSSQNNEWKVNIQSQLHVFFISSATPLLPPPQVLKGESAVPSLQQPRDKATNSVCVQTHTHRGDIQPCFQHLLSKAPGVVSLKKTWGWNLTPLLALCKLEPSPCHCDRHYCVSRMAGRLMSAILWGPRRPLQPSLTGEQFICQHPPARLRYLIPPLTRGQGSHGEHLQPHRSPNPSRRGQSKALGWLRDKCLHWMVAITHWQERDLTNCTAITEWEFLYWLSEHVIVTGSNKQKNKYGCIHA